MGAIGSLLGKPRPFAEQPKPLRNYNVITGPWKIDTELGQWSRGWICSWFGMSGYLSVQNPYALTSEETHWNLSMIRVCRWSSSGHFHHTQCHLLPAQNVFSSSFCPNSGNHICVCSQRQAHLTCSSFSKYEWFLLFALLFMVQMALRAQFSCCCF